MDPTEQKNGRREALGKKLNVMYALSQVTKQILKFYLDSVLEEYCIFFIVVLLLPFLEFFLKSPETSPWGINLLIHPEKISDERTSQPSSGGLDPHVGGMGGQKV